MRGVDAEIHYVRSSGASIAYQVVGSGAADLVFVQDAVSNLTYAWETPYWRPFYERLAESFRLILFDKRGTGLSDGGRQFATLETRMEDLRAVTDAVESERPVLLGTHEGCLVATLFAATYPERTVALGLFHPPLVAYQEPDYEATLAGLRDRWGERQFVEERMELICPTLYAREEARDWFVNWCRVGASPSTAYELLRAFSETDLTEVYAAVRVPTLVLYRGKLAADESLTVARTIPEAAAIRVSGSDYWGTFLSPDIADELERFVAGEAPLSVPESVLTTVLFTDLVGSSERAAELGDRAWRDLLAQHHAVVRRELTRFRGEERDTAGDGFFATFDGPARAIRCAEAIVENVRPLGLDVRAGIHTAECELHDGKLAGIALAIGARICAAADPGEVLVSRTVKDLVAGSGITLKERGRQRLKGVGDWELYRVA